MIFNLENKCIVGFPLHNHWRAVNFIFSKFTVTCTSFSFKNKPMENKSFHLEMHHTVVSVSMQLASPPIFTLKQLLTVIYQYINTSRRCRESFLDTFLFQVWGTACSLTCCISEGWFSQRTDMARWWRDEDEGVFLTIEEPADHRSPSFSTPSRFQVANSL